MHVESSVSSERPKRNVSEVDDLIVKRRGGGSIIDHRPLFSHDGEILYVVWKQLIRAYSTQTGDFVREFEPINNRIAGIAACPDSSNTILGCSDSGELIFWNCYNGVITKKLKLKIRSNDTDVKIRTFHTINYTNTKGNGVHHVLVTYVAKAYKRIRVALFDPDSGNFITDVNILHTQDEFDVGIIGNYGENLVAVVQGIDLHILDPARNLAGKLHKTSRAFTCVTGHPEEECVATGDVTGRVVVWKNIWQNRPCQATYHWHTLPVTEIAFSTSGGHMYTGGSECVLVKWTLANPQYKSFLPRLPAPIKYLTISPENLYVAVSTLDNGIIVVNPQKKFTSVIQNFTWGVVTSRRELFPAGLTVDPRTSSLVLNSRTGHIQFYSTHTRSLLYNINITAQNFLTQERDLVIVNTEVTKVTLSQDGMWMATIEERDDKVSNIEIRLKFWMFDMEKQIYALNTSIELPHDGGVNALRFQPSMSFDSDHLLAVTTGKDKKFKLWNLAESSSEHKKVKHWYYYNVGFYRNLSATDAGFSMDGSLLGIGFESSLTIWTPERNELKCSLTHSLYSHTITRIEFGRHESCHLVVVGSHEHIAVWNLSTLNVIWSVPLKLSTLAADPNSVYMAAFTTDNKLYIFTPQSSKPVYTKKNLVDEDSFVLGASFVPHLQEKRNTSTRQWQRKSQLFFLDSNQELLTLESESEMGVFLESLPISGTIPATAFSALLAAQTVSSKEHVTPYTHEQLGVPGKGIIQELLNIPAHTLPPMRMLCASLLLSLMAEPTSKIHSTDDKMSRYDTDAVQRDSRTDSDDDDEEEEKVEEKEKTVKSVKREASSIAVTNIENSSARLISHDWTFVPAILPSRNDI